MSKRFGKRMEFNQLCYVVTKNHSLVVVSVTDRGLKKGHVAFIQKDLNHCRWGRFDGQKQECFTTLELGLYAIWRCIYSSCPKCAGHLMQLSFK